MILLDANALIALLDARDAHHSAVVRTLEDSGTETLAATSLTVAEALVHPLMAGTADDVEQAFEALELERIDLRGGDARGIARVRAETRLRMPDALVIWAAERLGARLLTTDAAVLRAADRRGVAVADFT